jgi:hypothetical protein
MLVELAIDDLTGGASDELRPGFVEPADFEIGFGARSGCRRREN